MGNQCGQCVGSKKPHGDFDELKYEKRANNMTVASEQTFHKKRTAPQDDIVSLTSFGPNSKIPEVKGTDNVA